MRDLTLDEVLARPELDPMAHIFSALLDPEPRSWQVDDAGYVHFGSQSEHRAALQLEANARAVIDAAIDREQRRAYEHRRFNKFLDAALFDYLAYVEGRPMGGLWWIIEGDEPWAPVP